ncbi:GNAT family N-acetyltransferase, partial [Streptomyces sp. NPDC048279]
MILQTGSRGGVAPLGNAVRPALAGPHTHLAEQVGRAARHPDDVYGYAAPADPAAPDAWADLR